MPYYTIVPYYPKVPVFKVGLFHFPLFPSRGAMLAPKTHLIPQALSSPPQPLPPKRKPQQRESLHKLVMVALNSLWLGLTCQLLYHHYPIVQGADLGAAISVGWVANPSYLNLSFNSSTPTPKTEATATRIFSSYSKDS